MTLSEFKAWFEGYTEALDGAPDEKQWKRIKAQVAKIDGTPLTQTVFIDRYRDYKWPSWPYPYVSYSAGTAVSGMGNAVLQNSSSEWDSHAALYEAGKLEYRAA